MDTAEHKRFSRCYRLTSAADYQRVFKQARRFSCAGFTILIRLCDEDQSRLGLIVSKKAARRAVDRNRIKRQIRESFRQQRYNLGHFDIVVMAKPLLKEKANQYISNLLEKHWTKIAQCAQ